MKYLILLASLFLIITARTEIQAEKVYMWTDENGVVRYSNSEPPENAKNVRELQEIPHTEKDREQIEQNKKTFEQSLRELEAENRRIEAEDEYKKQMKQAREKEIAKKQLDRKIEAERERLQKEIDRIKNLPTSKSYRLPWKLAQIKKYQEKLKYLEESPEAYFAGKTAEKTGN